jgi:acetyl esterase/lipase
VTTLLRLVLTAAIVATMVALPSAQRRGRGAESVSLPRNTTHRNLPYVVSGGPAQQLDLYIPSSRQRPPIVVVVHGGAWSKGAKTDARVMEAVAALLRGGLAAASLNYRLSGEAAFPAQIHDVKAAVRWLRANASTYGFDAERIGAFGMSAGGHLVALLGTSGDVPAMDGSLGPQGHSTRVQAVVDWYGASDFLQMDANRVEGGLSHNAPRSPESRLLGGPLKKMQAEAEAANPITYITRDDPPFLIAHGDQDRLIPSHQSEILHEALLAAGVKSTLHIVKGAGHGFQVESEKRDMVEFFKSRLIVSH